MAKDIAELKQEWQRASLPLVEKLDAGSGMGFNDTTYQFKLNQILDILESSGLLRTK